MSRLPLVLAAALAACAATPATPTAAPAATGAASQTRRAAARQVHYSLEIPDPTRQWVHVRMSVPQPRGARSQIAMPAWTPGSYLVRDHARHVDGLRAEDLAGRPLPVHRIDKQTWRVDHGRRGFTVHYRVFAGEPGVRTSFVDDRHASLNGTSIFMYLVGQTARPASLDITLPKGWRAHTALPGLSTTTTTARFHAADYDTLADSPILLGAPELRSFDVDGTRVELVFLATAGSNADTARLAADLQKIVATYARLMGGLPMRRYVFLVLADSTSDGGLEHADSTLLRVQRDMFSGPAGYRRFADLAAHEFFHLWNVKRIRDAALIPYDYRGETYTRLLWFHEGFTETVEQQVLVRAGIVEPAAHLQELASAWTAYLRKPGRNHAPLGELSYDAWTKAYKPSPSHGNTLISYYEKGHLLGVSLDLELRLRAASHGQQGSLVGLFRRLMTRPQTRGPARIDHIIDIIDITRADIIAAASAEAGEPMDEFFTRYVDGLHELPLPDLLPRIGVLVRSEPASASAWTGLVLTAERRVKNIEPGSPAAAAGLMLGDELIAVAGKRVLTGDDATARLGERKPGERLDLAVFRDGRLELRPLTLAADPHRSYHFELAPAARLPPQTRGLRDAWLARSP